jgi:hypothetical protein
LRFCLQFPYIDLDVVWIRVIMSKWPYSG